MKPTWQTCYSKTSQVLSPTEEEELAKQVTKMGGNGPVIFDRHFFTMVRKYNTLPRNVIVVSSTQEIDRHHEHNFEWINFVREPVSRLVTRPDHNFWNNPLTLTFILGVNVPLPEETFTVGFKEESTSQGLN